MSLTVFVCTPTWQIATVDRALVTWVKTENWIHSYLKKIKHYRPRDHGAPEYRLLVIIIKHKDPKGHPVFMLLFYHFYPPPSKSVVEHIILQALPGYFLLRSCWNYDLVKRRQFFFCLWKDFILLVYSLSYNGCVKSNYFPRIQLSYILLLSRTFSDNSTAESTKQNPDHPHTETRPSFFGGVPSYFEALWYPHLYFYRKSNT